MSSPLHENPQARNVSYRRYLIAALALGLFAAPAALSAFVIGFTIFSVGLQIALPVSFAFIAIFTCLIARMNLEKLPPSAFLRLLPFVIACLYYLLLWIVFYALAGYMGLSIDPAFSYLSFLFIPISAPLSLAGDAVLFPLIAATLFVVLGTSLLLTCWASRTKSSKDRRIIPLAAVLLLVFAVTGYQLIALPKVMLGLDSGVSRVGEEIDYFDYEPFRAGNKLEVFPGTPSLTIDHDYPRLDGATAAYPVYSAIAQALYTGLNVKSVLNYVTCSTTNYAYERLANDEVDIVFGAQPSVQQSNEAAMKGVEFVMTPIAQEAFVFFVNADNPVESLTLEEIQMIYTGQIINWKEVGGNDEEILAFQRNENSGSQTIMEAVVMGGSTLETPIMEQQRADSMGGVINGVATYRNYSSSIGYSFRYYATEMNPNAGVKLIAINGIEPTIANIENGTYPFVVDVYAVTTDKESTNTQLLLKWILSEEGQSFIEQCGYTRAKIEHIKYAP